jgi:Tol biopolymer transport system component/DNA-binding winged helix-turn-helix (wHTH) protein
MTNHSDRARFGPFEIDLHTHEVWKFGTRLKLVGQPFEILAVLLSRPGELVTREELRNRLWPTDTFVDFNHSLNAAVNKLREALSDSANEPRYIETLPRRGYRFIAEVEWATTSPSVRAAAPDQPTSADTDAPLPLSLMSAGETEILSPIRFPQYLLGAGVLFTLFIAGLFLLKTASANRSDSSNSPPIEHVRPLMAVPDTSAPAFSPDGNSVAFFRERSQPGESGIYVTTVGSNQLLQLTNNERDCCPVWSPDRRWIAFSRMHDRAYSIYLVPVGNEAESRTKTNPDPEVQFAEFKLTPASSTERKLDTLGVTPSRGELDWSPDGKSLVFAGPSGLYLISSEHSAVRRMTDPPPAVEDWGPAFSPDGQTVLFVRSRQVGEPDELWTVPAGGGEGVRLLSERGKITSPPRWSFDGRSVIFSSNRIGHPSLFRASLDAPDSAVAISEAGSPAWDPTVSRRGYRLAYERLQRSLSIWQMNLAPSPDHRPYLLVPSTSDTDQGPGPQYSPDGKKLAYMSDRSGTMEIWVSDRDGGNAFQLSAVGGAGTPRWSPDSQSIVFDTVTRGGSKIVTMRVRGGPPRMLSPETVHDVCPSWSRDGKWIYFASPRSGAWQVWKMPSAGGDAMQVTEHGGHTALESPDGKYLYYSKSPWPEPEVWRVPVAGGEETPMPLVRPGTWASWQVVEHGILFVGPSLGHQAVLSFYDFSTSSATTLAFLDRTPFWLGATRDGRAVAFDQPGMEQDQAMLVENFR